MLNFNIFRMSNKKNKKVLIMAFIDKDVVDAHSMKINAIILFLAKFLF